MTLNGCRQIRCIPPVTAQAPCASTQMMRNKASACKAEGRDYETYTTGVCRMVRCVNEEIDAAPCASDAAINAAGVRCTKQGLTPSISSDDRGCRKVTCKEAVSSSATSSCPSDAALDDGIKVCKNSGMTGTTMQDENGCRQVICQPLRKP